MSRRNRPENKAARRKERTESHMKMPYGKQIEGSKSEPKGPESLQEFIGNKGICINMDDYSHYDFYTCQDMLADLEKAKNNNEEIQPISKQYAVAFFTDYLFNSGWHREFDYQEVAFLLNCREMVVCHPSFIDSFCLFQNKSAPKVLEAIYSNPVEKRKFLLDEFFGRNKPKPKPGEEIGLCINMEDVYAHPQSEYPYVFVGSNRLQMSVSQKEYDHMVNLSKAGENVNEYLDELWAERKKV